MQKRIIRPHDRPVQRVHSPNDPHAREVAALGELMLGAAWADGDKGAIEVIAVAEQLKEFVDVDHIPNVVARRLERFDPASFDVEAACRELTVTDDDGRLAVLQLIARVIGADASFHPQEIVYIKRVAAALGIDPNLVQIQVKGPPPAE
jgi:uncharacterized tellurite resistance protein B-like protein